MSKRIQLSDRELRVIGLTVKFVLKDEHYHSDNSLLGKLGKEELETVLAHLGLEEKNILPQNNNSKGKP